MALCLLEVWAAWALWLRRWRLANWVMFGSPLLVLAICIGRLGLEDLPAALLAMQPLEHAFLAVNVMLMAVAVSLLRRKPAGRHGPVDSASTMAWALWTVNAVVCAVMVYLAFFFRLF